MFQSPFHNNSLQTCGVYVVDNGTNFFPLVSLDAHTTIVSSTSRTVLTQNFVSPKTGTAPLKNVRYVFPLYDGVSVVGFKCTFGSKVIKGVVKERHEAKRAYQDAVAKGQTAGLLEQYLGASDVFTTSLGNIPSGEDVKIEITYLGELKHDAQVDGLRFTIPTAIAHRYGRQPTSGSDTFRGGEHIKITVDVDVSGSSTIKSIQSPSHPISVNIGTLSTATSDPPSLQKAYATLSLGTSELEKDFIIQVVATGLGDPMAVLETHPTIPNQRALMATLVPRFHLPMGSSEVVFMCDRSGSMGGQKMTNVVSALQIFLKSLPVGIKFNICSFGSHFSFLWDRSKTYDEDTLNEATAHVSGFSANCGGTEMYAPLEAIFKRRYQDMNLEVFLLTDGETWGQERLIQLVNDQVAESKGAVRVFSLGIGKAASHALIEGVARAGNGFAQTVAENEKIDKMVVRMLKGALTPHINDYTLEIKYEGSETAAEETSDDDFEIIEKIMDAMTLELPSPETTAETTVDTPPKPISLFDPSIKDKDLEMSNTSDSVKVTLPPVAVPRYLQAPFKIPSLFPFNRTTVYVLLSDSTPNRQPKSVILRGSFKHGPVELEVPITTLAEKATTIHQLAARKATRELEDGRGWIFHAKNKEGKLLKEQYDGQFDDMVKREAVRLGTQYQVSGKWCSFVAIQDSDKDTAKADDNNNEGGQEGEEIEDENDLIDYSDEDHHRDRFPRRMANKRAKRASAPTQERMVMQASAAGPSGTDLQDYQSSLMLLQQGSRSRKMMVPAPNMAAMPNQQPQGSPYINPNYQPQRSDRDREMAALTARQAPAGGFMQGSSGMTQQMQAQWQAQQQAMQMQQQAQQQARLQMQAQAFAGGFGTTSGAFGGSAWNSQASLQGQSQQLQEQNLRRMQMAAQQQSLLQNPFQQQQQQQQQQQSPFQVASSSTMLKREPPSDDSLPKRRKSGSMAGDVATGDTLSELSALQTFAGNWQWSPKLESVLGVTVQLAMEKLQLPGHYKEHMDVVATLCAVVFLRKKLGDEKDAWELLVNKAEDWLGRNTMTRPEQLEKIVGDTLFAD